MRKITERGQSLGLLELEEPNDTSRPRRQVETANIPDPVLEEAADAEASVPFLRARQRVPVRRRGGSRFASRFGWKSRWVRVAVGVIAFSAIGLAVAVGLGMKSLLLHNPRFLLRSAGDIQVTGSRVVSAQQVLAIFDQDMNHSVFHVPLAKRQAELEKIRWVRRATVMRLWPDKIHVSVLERSPVAFARDGNTVRLVDDDGVLLNLPDAAAQHYSFPVLNGVSSAEPLSTRAARMELYRKFTRSLDAEGGNISSGLSEVDLSDPEDVRAMFADGHQPLVHFGDSDFLPRYRAYREHLKEWQQQYPKLQSVDMRYGRQVVLDSGSVAQQSDASTVLTDTPPEKPFAPPAVNDVPQPPKAVAPAKNTDSKKSAKPAKSKAAKKVVAKKHHAATHKIAPRHKPPTSERGHPVRNPIMHTVSGA